MVIKVDTVQVMTDVPQCMSLCQIKQATTQDEHLQWLKSLIISDCPDTNDQLHQGHQAILVIQGRSGSHRWCGHERKVHYHP